MKSLRLACRVTCSPGGSTNPVRNDLQRSATKSLGKRQTSVGPSARDLHGMNGSGLFQYGRICLCDHGIFTTLASASRLGADDAGRVFLSAARGRPLKSLDDPTLQ